MSAKYMHRRGAVWHFRIWVPLHLQSVFGKKELAYSLKTSCKHDARVKSVTLERAAHLLFMKLSLPTGLTSDEVKALSRDYFSECLELLTQAKPKVEKLEVMLNKVKGDKAYSEAEQDTLSTESIFHVNNLLPPYPQMQKGNFSFNGVYEFEGEPSLDVISDYVLQKHDIDTKQVQHTRSHKTLKAQLTRAIEHVEKLQQAYMEGHEDYPADELFDDLIDDYTNPEATLQISVLYAKYLGEIDKAAATFVKKHAALAIFLELMGDVSVKRFSKADARQFKEHLMKLPSHIKQRYPNTPLKALLKLNFPANERMAHNTINNYFNDMRSFFTWCINNSYYDDSNPFSGLNLQKNKRSPSNSKDRTSFSAADIQCYFNSPIYIGCKSRTRRYEVGDKLYKDALYWIPLLLLFTGARLSEITDMYVEDIRIDQDTDIMFLDIKPRDERMLKTESSERTIPLHNTLITLGFLEYVDKHKNNTKLFEHELTKSAAYGTFAKNMSRKINRILKDVLKINKDGKKPLHSFRHTFIDAMRIANIHPDIMSGISGHKRDGVIGSYGSNQMLKQKKEAIDKVAFEGFELV